MKGIKNGKLLWEINLTAYKFILLNDSNWIPVLSLPYSMHDWNKY